MDTQEIGKYGEKIARQYLERKGYVCRAMNYRYRRAEIDLIMEKEDLLLFIEVKTRTCEAFGMPEEAVTPPQEGRIQDAAEAYLLETDWQHMIRFDIVSIILQGKRYKVRHFIDAF